MDDRASRSAEARHSLRAALLQPTLAHAASNSKFYQRHWCGRDLQVRCLEDLSTLPILTKEDVSEGFDDLLCTSAFPALIQHTTGTTGKPLRVYRSAEELRFIRDFFLRTIPTDLREPMPAVLHLADLYHGPSLEIPTRAHSVRAGMTDDILLTEAVRLLTTEHDVPGGRQKVSTIVGLVPYIKTFTNYLVETGFDFSRSTIRVICPLCTIVTPRWRSLLSSVWSAHVVDRYSLAEVFGGATRCLRCESFHFDPVVIPEVVNISSQENIREGVGALLLTTLFPFVQMQPMIRYWTGDLVEVSLDSCQPDLSVRFKGRISSTPIWERSGHSKVILCPVDIYECLDGLPDIGVSDRFIDIRAVRDHTAAGALRFRMSVDEHGGRPLLRVEIELRYSPHLYPSRCDELRRQIRANLQRLSPSIASGEVELGLDFLPPSSLPPFSLKI
jgi:phenylacetate-coenzyme A ligase PaaK-like adenylate-forming protein